MCRPGSRWCVDKHRLEDTTCEGHEWLLFPRHLEERAELFRPQVISLAQRVPDVAIYSRY